MNFFDRILFFFFDLGRVLLWIIITNGLVLLFYLLIAWSAGGWVE